jgi:regulator of protease activity HflC (stomatin/prohibitin superfamily)
MDQLAEKLSFRVQELNVKVETKTLDNVFVIAVLSVQYQVLQEKVYDAVYALTNPVRQITAHVFDVMRSLLPTLELDAVFEAKDDLALAVKNALAETMSGYGYQILQVLITDIEPDKRVKVCFYKLSCHVDWHAQVRLACNCSCCLLSLISGCDAVFHLFCFNTLRFRTP